MTLLRLMLIGTCACFAQAQTPDLQQLAQRLEQLDKENQRLRAEIEELRKQISAAQATPVVEEKIQVLEERIAEQAQTKVEAVQRFPLKVSGLVLMNGYRYSGHTESVELPMVAGRGARMLASGGTLRQSQLAFLYQNAKSILGAGIGGRLQVDFFGGSLNTQNNLVRIRTADVTLQWTRRSLSVGVDKPILSPREPDSIAQLGFSPLANSGNLWLWQPQIRYEERFMFGERTGLTARAGVYQTNEAAAFAPAAIPAGLSRSRPALQGRFELHHTTEGGLRFEIAPGFHRSESRIGSLNLDSYAASVDWLVPFGGHLDLSGFLFKGQNLAGLGISGLQQSILPRNGFKPVRGHGGWSQIRVKATDSLSFHFFGGMQDDVNSDLLANGIERNLSYAANLRWRIAPNVVIGLEAMQIRSVYRESFVRLINRYDLAIGYLF